MITLRDEKNGQGYSPEHKDNPHHDMLISYGWTYSHTTRIHQYKDNYYYLHTYKYPGSYSNISIKVCEARIYPAYASTNGSSRQWVFYGSQLETYVRRKTAALKKKPDFYA